MIFCDKSGVLFDVMAMFWALYLAGPCRGLLLVRFTIELFCPDLSRIASTRLIGPWF